MAPAGKANKIPVVTKPLWRLGAYSDASDSKTGVAPPMPKPAITRKMKMWFKWVANAVSKVEMANKAMHTIRVLWRPSLSPNMPSSMAPTVMPMMPAVKTGANALASNPKASMMAGPVKATAWVSKPSNKAIKKHKIITRH